MKEEQNNLCWYGKFSSQRCQNIAKWHWPTSETAFARACRWCDDHKHNNDILLVDEAERKE